MFDPELVKKAKALAEEMKKREKMHAEYGKKLENITSPLDRVVSLFFDMSGTKEADEANIELIKSIRTRDGQQKLFARFMDKIMSIDPAVFFTDDVEKIIDAQSKNFGAAACAFAVNSIESMLPADLRPSGKAAQFIKDNKLLWENGCVVNSYINLVANDFDELPKKMDKNLLEKIATKQPEKAVIIPDIITIMEAKGNEKSKLSGAFAELEKRGISGTDIYKYNYYNANHEPISLFDALNDIKAEKDVVIEQMTQEQLKEQEKMLHHVEKYGVAADINSKTPVAAYPGVTGVGISARTTKTMDSMDGQGAFYGGFDVDGKIKDQLETQNVSAILNFSRNDDGTFHMSYKLPENGGAEPSYKNGIKPAPGSDEKPLFTGGEFNIRRNVNVFSKAVAGYLMGSGDTMSYSVRVGTLDDALDRFKSGIYNADNAQEVKASVDKLVNLLNVHPDKDREELTGFLSSAYANCTFAAMMASETIHEIKRMGNYSELATEGREYSKTETRFVKASKDDFARMIADMRRMKDMDVDATTEMPFHLNSRAFASFTTDAVDMYNFTHPQAKIEHGKKISIKLDEYEKQHPEVISDAKSEIISFDEYEIFAVENIKIGDKTVCLSIENSDPPYNRILMNNGSNAAIGFYDSRDNIVNAALSDAVCYCDDIQGIANLKMNSQYTPASGYFEDSEGTFIINETPVHDPYVEAEETIGAEISVNALNHMLSATETYLEKEIDQRELYDMTEEVTYKGPSKETLDMFAAIRALSSEDTVEQRNEKLAQLKEASALYINKVDPNVDKKNPSHISTKEFRCLTLARAAFKFAAGSINAIEQSGYDRVINIETRAKDYCEGQSISSDSVFKDYIDSDISKRAYTGLDLEKLIHMSAGERDNYLAAPAVTEALYVMSEFAGCCDKIIRTADVNDKRKAEEYKLKSELFKSVIEGAKCIADEKRYLFEHPGADKHNIIDRALRAERAMKFYDRLPKNENLYFKTDEGREIDTTAASERIVNGDTVRIFSEKNPFFGGKIGKDGNLEFLPVLDNSIMTDNVKFTAVFKELAKELSGTDKLLIMTNSKEFSDLKLILNDMTDPSKKWTNANKENAMPYIVDYCDRYLGNKKKEQEKKGVLDDRSRRRVKIVSLIKETAKEYEKFLPGITAAQKQKAPQNKVIEEKVKKAPENPVM